MKKILKNDKIYCRKSFAILSVFLLIVFLYPHTALSQIKTSEISVSNNSLKFQISINDRVALKDTNGIKYISFPNSLDESKPGSPVLPSQTVFVAVPPKSRANTNLSNQHYKTYQDINVEVNPEVVKLNDSTLTYKSQSLRKEYFQTDQYPSLECKVVGYTWIRNYYCAIIKIKFFHL